MKSKFLFFLTIALVFIMLVFVSCKSVEVESTTATPKHGAGYGPPPHAPAHGYRHKYQDVELIFDSGRGVYIVVELPNHFFFNGYFYRLEGTQWQISANIKGPWEAVPEKSLPPGLRDKEKIESKPKEHPGRGLGLKKKN